MGFRSPFFPVVPTVVPIIGPISGWALTLQPDCSHWAVRPYVHPGRPQYPRPAGSDELHIDQIVVRHTSSNGKTIKAGQTDHT